MDDANSLMTGSVGSFAVDDISVYSVPTSIAFSVPAEEDSLPIAAKPTKDKSKHVSGRHWFCTLHPNDGSEDQPAEFTDAKKFAQFFGAIQSIGAQFEYGTATGKFHCQIMVRFENTKSASAFRKKLYNLGWQGNIVLQDKEKRRMRDRLAGYRYCVKDATRVPGTKPLIWGMWDTKYTLQHVLDHNVPETRSAKRKAASLADSTDSQRTKKITNLQRLWDIVITLPIYRLNRKDILRHINSECHEHFYRWAGCNTSKVVEVANSEMDRRDVPDRLNQGCHLKYGAAGTGKTTRFINDAIERSIGTELEGAEIRHHFHKYVYQEKSFQDYCNQPNLWLPEFHGSLQLRAFKNICEQGRRGSEVYHMFPRKNTTPINLNCEWVLMDCNCNLTAQYPNLFAENRTNWDAFSRRFTIVEYYPHCRLQPGATSLTDFFYDENDTIVCNKYHAVNNPNPSFVDVTRFVKGRPFDEVVVFESNLDNSHLIGTKRDVSVITSHVTHQKDYSYAIGVWEWSLTRNIPKWIEDLTIKYKQKVDADTFDIIKTRFMSGIHTPPDVEYDNGMWTVRIN